MTEHATKKYTNGTHRTRSPQQTLAKVMPHMKAMGVTRIANVTGLDDIGIKVVTVCRPNSKAISVAQGKGLDLDAAKASGLMEAVETWHAEQIDLPLRLASYREISSTANVVDVEQLPKLKLSRYHQDLPTLWIEGYDYATKQPTFVPFEVVHANYALPLPTGSGAFMMSTNGLASGNVLLEAISHGLCELIERDATALWRIQRTHLLENAPQQRWEDKQMLDLTTVDDPNCCHILSQFSKAGIAVTVWNITSDLNIPSFYCAIVNQTLDLSRPINGASGMGTHPAKGIALLRALTEAAQSRLTLISGSRDDLSANEYKDGKDADRHQKTVESLNKVVPLQQYAAIESWTHETLEQDMTLLTEQLAARGLDKIIVVDLSKPAYDIPVVRVVVPGLEGIDFVPGYRPGTRAKALYDKLCKQSL